MSTLSAVVCLPRTVLLTDSRCTVFIPKTDQQNRFSIAHSSKNRREPNWQDKLIDWWMSVRVQGATLVLGGLSLSWLIIRLRGKDKYTTEYERLRKSKQVKLLWLLYVLFILLMYRCPVNLLSTFTGLPLSSE